MIDAGLYALLAANSALVALLKNGADSIFAGDAPDDVAQCPCLGYLLVAGAAEPTLGTSGVIRQRVELNGFAWTVSADGTQSPGTVAAAIRDAVIAAVEGWQQKLADGTDVLDAWLLNPGADFVTEQRIFRAMCEFYVMYTRPTS